MQIEHKKRKSEKDSTVCEKGSEKERNYWTFFFFITPKRDHTNENRTRY